MKLFECHNCGQLLFFENERCEACGHVLGFLPEVATLSALTPEADGQWRSAAAPDQIRRLCDNARLAACNWLVPEEGSESFCTACRLNRTIPDLSEAGHLLRWRKLENAKHRLIYSLLRLGLPILSKNDDVQAGLAFDFLSATPSSAGEGSAVTTGHAAGLITIDLAEADDPYRESRRDSFAESYRTVLGHFRHEIGHYYWDRLVAQTAALEAFRSLFGDERKDYAASLEAHHVEGPVSDWPDHFVSAYASAHPWEDWAETRAHYLRILDTLETAYGFGLSLEPAVGRDRALATAIDIDPYDRCDFDVLLRNWLPLTYAVNGLNRSMGQPDFYPFVIAPAVVEKIRLIHRLVKVHETSGSALQARVHAIGVRSPLRESSECGCEFMVLRWLVLRPATAAKPQRTRFHRENQKGNCQMGIEVGGLIGLLILAGDIWAIVNTVQSGASTGSKVAWILAIVILPVLGLVIWLIAGPRTRAA